MNRQFKTNKNGFSLIELIVVIALLGIIAAVAVPSFTSILERSKAKQCVLNRKTAVHAYDIYSVENGSFDIDGHAGVEFLQNANLIGSDVVCTANGTYTWKVTDDITSIECDVHGDGANLYDAFLEYYNIFIGDIAGDNLVTGDNADRIIVGRDIDGDILIETNGGDDYITIENDFEGDAELNTGDGNDKVEILDQTKDSILNTGEGADIVDIGEIAMTSIIDTGTGDDIINIDSVSTTFDRGHVNLNDGDDYMTLSDPDTESSKRNLGGSEGTYDGGAGHDTLRLDGFSKDEWSSISKYFSNFETIIFDDGEITQ